MNDEEIIKSVKAAGDYALSVLGAPFGGHNNGKDSDGEFFSEKTNIYADQFPTVPVFYYHGMTPSGEPQGHPEVIGKATYSHKDGKGHWYNVVLDKASEYAKRVWEAAQNDRARASSGAIAHLVRKAANGEILDWALAELSVFDTGEGRQPANQYAVALPAAKSHYQAAGLDLQGVNKMSDAQKADFNITGGTISLEAMEAAIEAAVEKRMKAEKEAAAAALARIEKEESDKRYAELLKEKEEWKAEAAKANRLPNLSGAPVQAKYGETWKYDNHTAGDLSFAAQILLGKGKQPSQAMLKALALKMENDKNPATAADNRQALKAAGIKADETDYTSNTNYGAEWVGTSYGSELWEAVRGQAVVASQVPVGPAIPQGFSSVYIPLESTDPTFYKVAEATDSTYNSTTGIHNATVTASPVGTAQKQITVGKLGARVISSGEMEEDSLVAFAANARRQMAAAAAEVMDYLVINADSETGASTNINDIAGTPAATDLFLLSNGFRKLALVTNTANSRSAGGSLDITDFLETLKLMGTAGLNSVDVTKSAFIVDLNTYYKLMTLPELQTRDVFSAATLENGVLTRIYGRPVIASAFVHGVTGYGSSVRKANTAGKIDLDTAANNTTGAIIAVRWDQWQQRYKRNWTLEAVRRPESDTNEIVGLTRWGLGFRDNEASAITYNVGV